MKHIADIFGVKEGAITKNPKGRALNSARAFAMYASQEYGDMSLKEIAEAFGLGHTGSASFSTNKTRKEIAKGKWKKVIKALEKCLCCKIGVTSITRALLRL